MAKRPNLGQITNPIFSVNQLNQAFTKIDEAFDNTLSRDGSTPNTMLADLDMNSNDILNAGVVYGQSIDVGQAVIGGKLFTGTLTWRSDWLTATSYQENDLVKINGNVYVCLDEHISGVFATDLSTSKWEIFVQNAAGPAGPTGADGPQGPAGQGVPAGGTTGQVLAKIDNTNYNTQWVNQTGGGGVTDGDKGDITVSGSGATWTIDNGVVSLAKMANMTTSSLIYRKTAGTGVPEINTLATLKTDLGLTGTNSGDQTITLTGVVTGSGTGSFATSLGSFTKAQLNTAVSDGDVLYVGDVTSNATHTGDVTGSTALTIAANAVDNTKAADMAANTIKANATASTADPADLAVGTNTVVGRVAGNIVAAQLVTNQIQDDAVVNGKLANVNTATIKGRISAGIGDPEDLTGTQATTLLDTFTSSLKGLAPASGGGTTNFLRADGTWAAPSGGGGGLGDVVGPASATDNALVRFDTTTGKLIQNSAVTLNDNGAMTFPAIATPSAPASGNVTLFGRSVAGRILPAIIGPSGLDTSLNPHIGRNKIGMWQATGNSGTDTNFGFVAGSTGSSTGASVATTNLHTYMRRREWLVTAAATNAVAGFRGSAAQFTLGGTAAGLGGFHLIIRWGPATGVATSTHRAFMGMYTSVTAPTDVNPSTLLNMCGMGYDAADTQIQFMYNDGTGTATKVALGASFPKPSADRTSVYEIAMFAPSGTTQSLSYLVTDLASGATASGTATTDLPSTSTLLNPWGYISVGGTSSVIGLMVSSLYIETDY